jgi:conserved oligomeric Golgi complex subunit 4
MFSLTLDVLIRPWEKHLMGLRFTEVCIVISGTGLIDARYVQLGAIKFDRDLRAITTHLASQTAFGDSREKFLRLQQLSTLLNLDRVSYNIDYSLSIGK